MKLKTLKDIFANESNQYEEILKQEAIKWVKTMREEKYFKAIPFIKNFFNITEEDLK